MRERQNDEQYDKRPDVVLARYLTSIDENKCLQLSLSEKHGYTKR